MDRWMLVKASEDGKPVSWLTSISLAKLLDDPWSWAGVTSFMDLDDLPDDPNYWPEGVGVLIKYQVVVPVAAGSYKLPEEN